MWAYVKSFLYNSKKKQAEKKQLTLREKSMIVRHNTNTKLSNKGLKWTHAGWSQRCEPHTDWTIKIKDDITLPYIEQTTKNINFVSATKIPIIINNQPSSLQQYIENYGQYNPNIKINYNLSNSFNERIEMSCVVVLIPKDTSVIHIPTKLTHKYDRNINNNILLVSSQKKSTTLQEDKRKQDFNLEETMPETHEDIHYNICLEIPIIRSRAFRSTVIRQFNQTIKGTIVYYLYVDHTDLNDTDIDKIEGIFNNFKNETYNI